MVCSFFFFFFFLCMCCPLSLQLYLSPIQGSLQAKVRKRDNRRSRAALTCTVTTILTCCLDQILWQQYWHAVWIRFCDNTGILFGPDSVTTILTYSLDQILWQQYWHTLWIRFCDNNADILFGSDSVTTMLTYSLDQIPSWQCDWRSACRQISQVPATLLFHYCPPAEAWFLKWALSCLQRFSTKILCAFQCSMQMRSATFMPSLFKILVAVNAIQCLVSVLPHVDWDITLQMVGLFWFITLFTGAWYCTYVCLEPV